MRTYQTVLYRVDGSVAVISLNRPEKRNALNNTMLEELTDAIGQAGADVTVRVVLLRGEGKSFCAGQDLEAFEDEVKGKIQEHLVARYKPLILGIRSLEKPVIAAIHGFAAGAGASLALAADLRIMAEDASLIQVFSRIALIPDSGSTWFLASQVGFSRAFQLAIEAEPIPAGRCQELGLANRVVPPADLDRAAQHWADRIATLSPLSVALTKRALQSACHLTLDEAIELEAILQQRAGESADFQEGVRAFKEKRQPVFIGR